MSNCHIKNDTFEILMKVANVPEPAGISYPLEELQKVCNFINEFKPLGELAPSIDSFKITLENVSHQLVKSRVALDKLFVTVLVFPILKGEIVLQNIKEGKEIALTMRGTGMVDENSRRVSQYSFITADIKLIDKV